MKKTNVLLLIILCFVLCCGCVSSNKTSGTNDSENTPNISKPVTPGGNNNVSNKAKEYNVYYSRENDYSEMTSNSKKVIYGKEYELDIPNKVGFDFCGWYLEDTQLTDKDGKSLSIWNYNESQTVTAKFEVKQELSNFVYSSTNNEIHISGVIDKTVESVVVPDYVSYIGSKTFSGCGYLKSLIIPFIGRMDCDFNDRNIRPFGFIFGEEYYYQSIAIEQRIGNEKKNYYLPKSLKSVKITKGKILDYSFYNCSELTNIEFPEDTGKIGSYAFNNCSSLENITIPYNVSIIDTSAFHGCIGLKNAIFERKEGWYTQTTLGHRDISKGELESGTNAAELLKNNSFYAWENSFAKS